MVTITSFSIEDDRESVARLVFFLLFLQFNLVGYNRNIILQI